jgi:hypothetical protein
MINDLKPSEGHSWKYVDVTTLAEIIPRNSQNQIIENYFYEPNAKCSVDVTGFTINVDLDDIRYMMF